MMIDVVLAVDRHFALPLRTVVASVTANATDPERVRLWVATDRYEHGVEAMVAQLREHTSLSVQWLPVATEALADAPVRSPWSKATYLRLLLAKAMPLEVSRFLYLDADVVVETDLTPLFHRALDGRAVAAVLSFRIPPRRGPIDFTRHPYFNAGVLLVDRQAWIDQEISERCFECIAAHPQGLRLMDQDALNATLAGDWVALDRRWNQQASVWEVSHHALGISMETWQTLRRKPYIIHFSGLVKPWHYGNDHPLRDRFAHYYGMTGLPPLQLSPRSPLDVIRRATKLVIPRSGRPFVRGALVATKDLWRSFGQRNAPG